MTATGTQSWRRLASDDGSVTVFVAILVPALLLVIGLVVEGSAQLRAISRADAVAAEAARAAETTLDTRGRAVTVHTPAAIAAARAYLDQAGHPGRIKVTGPDIVTVSVTVTLPSALGLSGPHTATGTATARLGVAHAPPGAGS
jgi:hypothetical protein